ncbi:MAG: hypothetical protein GY851_33820 [bacterium]|nr:hypothetical protein [bacterium]
MDFLTDLPTSLEVIIPIGFFLFLCIAVPIGVIFMQVPKMCQGIHLTRLEQGATEAMYDELREDADRALAKGFSQFEGMFTFRAGASGFLAVWRHTEHPTYFVLFLTGGKKALTFITEFSPDLDLTTANIKDAQLAPQAPGRYLQTFSKISLDELLDRHLAAARYITTMGGVHVEPVPWGFEDAFTKGEAIHGSYIQTLPAWPLRAPYWFYIRRRLLHNKSVEQLHKSGRLLLPNDRDYRPFTLDR